MIEPFRTIVEEFVLTYYERLSRDSFEKHGNRTFLKKGEEIQFIQAVHKKLEKRVALPAIRARTGSPKTKRHNIHSSFEISDV